MYRRVHFAVWGSFLLQAASTADPEVSVDLGQVGLGTVPGLRIDGAAPFDRSGLEVTGVGDVNADGSEDFLVTAILADPGGRDSAGEVYLLFGDSELGAGGVLDLNDLDGSNGLTIEGLAAFDQAGGSVTGAGDVNADGIADFAIASRFAGDGDLAGAGRVYLIYGSPSLSGGPATFDLASLDGSNGVVFSGLRMGDSLGSSIRSLGDINADGADDLGLGAPRAPGDDRVGETYVVLGQPGGLDHSGGEFSLGSLDGTNGFRITGLRPEGWHGFPRGAGDFNGDGFDDFLVAGRLTDALGQPGSIEAYLLYGQSSLPGPGGDQDLAALGAARGVRLVIPEDPVWVLGIAAASAGDVNGDGLDDLLISAANAEIDGLPVAGRAFLLWGQREAVPAGSSLLLDAPHPSRYAIIEGYRPFSLTGHQVDGAGDFDGDGCADLLIGSSFSPDRPENVTARGEAYVLWGNRFGLLGPGGLVGLGNLTADQGFSLIDQQIAGAAGRGSGSLGDVNGDGVSDIGVGAYFSTAGSRTQSGRTYVLFGTSVLPHAVYRDHARPGVAPLQRVGEVGQRAQSTAFSRCAIGFRGGAGPGGGASLQSVTLWRTDGLIQNLADPPRTRVADVMWEIDTNRRGPSLVQMTLTYLDREIEGLSEGALRVFWAPAPSGPWRPVPWMANDAARNRFTVAFGTCGNGGAFFAIAEGTCGCATSPDEIEGYLLGLRAAEMRFDVNDDFVIDAADLTTARELAPQP